MKIKFAEVRLTFFLIDSIRAIIAIIALSSVGIIMVEIIFLRTIIIKLLFVV